LRLATHSWGEVGRPLAVLVHGVTASTRTWWRVGAWFAENGWRAVAVDLRGHGASPRMQGDEELGDLAADVHETVFEGAGTVDVLLGHSLGALVALKLCEDYGEPARRLVLEDPPGPESTDFGEVARETQARVVLARGSSEEAVRRNLTENPAWTEEDARNNVAGILDCDAGPVLGLLRGGLRYELAAMVLTVSIPTLLVLGGEERGSVLLGPERQAVAGALRRGTVEEFDAGHSIHRDDFEGYTRLLGGWLGEPGAPLSSAGAQESGPREARAKLETFTIETFSGHLGSTFSIHLDDLPHMDVELISATRLGGSAGKEIPDRRQPFSIVFRGPGDVLLPQRIYPMEHDQIGSFDLFLVPIGPDEKGLRYEAVFT
jgi:pimeloyl-ACP methyl ester carboxylesterase